MADIVELIKDAETTIVDVRTPSEFSGGHVAGSVNIPLNELPARMAEIRNMQKVVLCCASGGRSGQAATFLKQNGIACENGGSWVFVNYHKAL